MSALSVSTALAVQVALQTQASVSLTNPLWRRQKIPAGFTYAGRHLYFTGLDVRNSNVFYEIIEVALHIAHNLADPTNESVYVLGNMLTDQAILMDPNFYSDLAGVHEVFDGPSLTPPERIGNVIEYVITTQLVIT